jgi:hypothetical protein
MTLLNVNQQRRVSTHLRLLVEDLEALSSLPELGGVQPAVARVRDRLTAARAAAETTRRMLDLPPDQPPGVRRRVAAIGEVWAARVEDLRAERLQAYGEVHPDLATALDPALARLRHALEALADAATELTEP